MSAPGNTPRGDGKRGYCTDCGGPGTYATANFIICDRRCGFSDGVPEYVDPEITFDIVVCPDCGEDDPKPWSADFNDADGKTFWTCRGRNCGKSFHA